MSIALISPAVFENNLNLHYPKVFIVIINWNGKTDTLECLESVKKMNYPNFSTVVVDNGSKDDSVSSIQESFPEVKVIATGENLGFAAGNNVGIKYALSNKADYVLLLNNDTVVDSNMLQELIEASGKFSDSGIFGAKIYYYLQPDRIWYAGGKWADDTQHFLHVGQGIIDNGNEYNTAAETDYVCGCALFVKTEVFNKIGLLDEKYYLTYEETDFCYRARKAGYKSIFIPEARLWHKISTSFGGAGSSLYHYFLTRNRLLWAEKNLPFKKLITLYIKAFSDAFRYALPPRFSLNRDRSLTEYKQKLKEKYNDPIKKAKIRGTIDYLFRNFGDCPASVRNLTRK